MTKLNNDLKVNPSLSIDVKEEDYSYIFESEIPDIDFHDVVAKKRAAGDEKDKCI